MQVDAGEQRADRDRTVADGVAEVAGEDDCRALPKPGEVNRQCHEQRDSHRLQKILESTAQGIARKHRYPDRPYRRLDADIMHQQHANDVIIE